MLVEHLQKTKNKIQKFKETGNSRYIYQNELDKAFFQYDIAYGDFQDLTKEQLLIKYCVIILLKIRNTMDINADLLQWFLSLLIKILLAKVLKIRICQTRN